MSALKKHVALWTLLPLSVMAQEMDHSKMSMPMDMPMSHGEMGADKKPVKPKKKVTHPASGGQGPASAKESQAPTMDHSKMSHDMPGMDHSMMGHDHAGSTAKHLAHSMPETEPSKALVTPRTPIPVLTDADRAAAGVPAMAHDMNDDTVHSYTLLNRLESWNANPGAGIAWEGGGWIGTDLNRLWWRSEGERIANSTEGADVELLFGRSISPWWDVVGGVRQDLKPGDGQTFAAIGVQGLAPQNFEMQATAYLGQRGQTALRFESDYELLFTNRLILQPRLEVNAYGRNDPARGIGAGFNSFETGLRLRYEFTRQIAPYIGIAYERSLGNTARLREKSGEDPGDFRVLAGLRIWL